MKASRSPIIRQSATKKRIVEMEQHSNTFEKLVLNTFTGAKLYRASDIPGRRWNTYGSPGIVRIEITKSGDYQGWGVLTFHNQRIGVLGLNVLLVPNFVMDHSIQHPRRLTFKARSRSLGNNGKKNMYSLKLASSEDAARLWYIVFLLQLAAKQARAGSPITIPSSVSVEATVVRAFIGTDQDEVDRQLVLSRLSQLAQAVPASFSSANHQWSETFFAAPFPPDHVKEFACIGEDGHSVNGSLAHDSEPDGSSSVLEESTSGVDLNAQVTHDEGDESDDSDSLGSNADFAESQDWFSAFAQKH